MADIDREGTVLVVDDEPGVLSGIKALLRREPYQVVTARGATAAFGLLATQPVDVLVTDEQMPGLNGVDFLLHVQRQYPDVIALMLTGSIDMGVAERAVNEVHVHQFLTKPCDPAELRLAIRNAFDRRQLLREARRLVRLSEGQPAEPSPVDRSVDVASLLLAVHRRLGRASS